MKIQPTYDYTAKVVRVIDGDTVDVLVDLGFHVATTIRVRLNGIDTPEKNATDPLIRSAGVAASHALSQLLPANLEIVLRTFKDPKDKYGRWLGEIEVGSLNINDELIAMGHAMPYDGGKKT